MRNYLKLLQPFYDKRNVISVLQAPFYDQDLRSLIATDTYVAAIIETDNSQGFESPDDMPIIKGIIPNDNQERTIWVNADFLYKIAKFYKDIYKGYKDMPKEIAITFPNLNEKSEAIKFYSESHKATCLLMPILK